MRMLPYGCIPTLVMPLIVPGAPIVRAAGTVMPTPMPCMDGGVEGTIGGRGLMFNVVLPLLPFDGYIDGDEAGAFIPTVFEPIIVLPPAGPDARLARLCNEKGTEDGAAGFSDTACGIMVACCC